MKYIYDSGRKEKQLSTQMKRKKLRKKKSTDKSRKWAKEKIS